MAKGKKGKKLLKNVQNLVKSEVKKLKPGTFQKIGRKAGGLVGMSGLGAGAGRALAALTGHGDYHVVKNSLMGAGPAPSGGLVFDKRGRRGIRVCEREFLGNVTSSTGFSCTSYAIQPGMGQTFPWLSALAINFDEWEPNGIVFEYRSTSAEWNGTSQALGTVILVPEYDSTDANYASKVEMEAAEGAISTRASRDAICGVECAANERLNRVYYTRAGAVPSGGNIANFDLGKFQIATTGFAADSVVVGELWVSYDVTFYKKQLLGGQMGGTVLSSVYTNSTSVSTSAYFGTIGSQTSYGTFPMQPSGGATINFPAWISTGQYRVTILWIGTSAAVSAPAMTGTLCTELAPYQGGTAPDLQVPTNGTTSNRLVVARVYRIDGPAASITLSGGTLPASATFVQVEVTQLPGIVPLTPVS